MKVITSLFFVVGIIACIYYVYKENKRPDVLKKEGTIYVTQPYKVPLKTVYHLDQNRQLVIFSKKKEDETLFIDKACVKIPFQSSHCRETYIDTPTPLQMKYVYNYIKNEEGYFFHFLDIEEIKGLNPENNSSLYMSYRFGFLFIGPEELDCLYEMRSSDRDLLIEKCVDPKYIIAD